MPDDDNLLQFLDDDLRAELEQWGRHGPGAGVMRDIILEKQRKRQARREMTPVRRRRDIARETLKADMLRDADRYHIHSVLAMCGLRTGGLMMGRSSISSATGRTAWW